MADYTDDDFIITGTTRIEWKEGLEASPKWNALLECLGRWVTIRTNDYSGYVKVVSMPDEYTPETLWPTGTLREDRKELT